MKSLNNKNLRYLRFLLFDFLYAADEGSISRLALKGCLPTEHPRMLSGQARKGAKNSGAQPSWLWGRRTGSLCSAFGQRLAKLIDSAPRIVREARRPKVVLVYCQSLGDGTQTWSLCPESFRGSFTPVNSKHRAWMSGGRTGNMPVFPSPAPPE